ncbi:hypothetical protein [Ahrensia sp. 13_GOM-1096m]|uniref:hypothetical protein n=1 Tax=Ahrensia sp. 13_GOM-1096m TaxID=1380380 RepID=UPI000478A128|nr:hypothetical protein [Ahrensia sp. 13_GOM-1096m]
MSLLGNITALGVLASVAGGAWAGLLPDNAAHDPASIHADGSEDKQERYLELELIAVPLIVDNQVDGYLLSRFLVQINEEEAKRFDLNLETYLTDAIYRHLIATAASLNTNNTYRIFGETEDGLLNKINTELGVQMVDSVTISQLDILQNDALLIDDSVSGNAANDTNE